MRRTNIFVDWETSRYCRLTISFRCITETRGILNIRTPPDKVTDYPSDDIAEIAFVKKLQEERYKLSSTVAEYSDFSNTVNIVVPYIYKFYRQRTALLLKRDYEDIILKADKMRNKYVQLNFQVDLSLYKYLDITKLFLVEPPFVVSEFDIVCYFLNLESGYNISFWIDPESRKNKLIILQDATNVVKIHNGQITVQEQQKDYFSFITYPIVVMFKDLLSNAEESISKTGICPFCFSAVMIPMKENGIWSCKACNRFIRETK